MRNETSERALKNEIWVRASEQSLGPETIFERVLSRTVNSSVESFTKGFLDKLVRISINGTTSRHETVHLKDARVQVSFNRNNGSVSLTIHHAQKLLPEERTLTLPSLLEVPIGEEHERLILTVSNSGDLIVYHPVLREPTELLTNIDWALKIFSPYLTVWGLDHPDTLEVEPRAQLLMKLMQENEDAVSSVIDVTLPKRSVTESGIMKDVRDPISNFWGTPFSGLLNVDEKGFLPQSVDLNRIGVHEFFARFVMRLMEPGRLLAGKTNEEVSQFETQVLKNMIALKPAFEKARDKRGLG